jgi:hypothetical protein
MDDEDYDPNRQVASTGYAWEEEYKRSWDILQEDEDGSIKHIVQQLQQTRKRYFELNQGKLSKINLLKEESYVKWSWLSTVQDQWQIWT